MAKPIAVSIPHTLGTSEARRRINLGFHSIRDNSQSRLLGSVLSVQERWEGDRLYFNAGGFGQKLEGRLDVLANTVEIQIEVPEILALVASRLLTTLGKGTQQLLE